MKKAKKRTTARAKKPDFYLSDVFKKAARKKNPLPVNRTFRADLKIRKDKSGKPIFDIRPVKSTKPKRGKR
jgi:hypothetical protein